MIWLISYVTNVMISMQHAIYDKCHILWCILYAAYSIGAIEHVNRKFLPSIISTLFIQYRIYFQRFAYALMFLNGSSSRVDGYLSGEPISWLNKRTKWSYREIIPLISGKNLNSFCPAMAAKRKIQLLNKVNWPFWNVPELVKT